MRTPGFAPPVSIRPAVIADYPALLELWRLCGVQVSAHGRESEAAFQRQLAEARTV